MRIIAITLLLFLTLLNIPLAHGRRRGKRTEIELNSDTDVVQYLKKKGQDMAIFWCKKLVMIKWLHSVVPYVDLECQVLGDAVEVNWYCNDTLIDTTTPGGRQLSVSTPHYRLGTFYDKWLDYKLRLLHVTEKDNGWYTIKVRSAQGLLLERLVLLEVMTEYRDEKWIKWMDNIYGDKKKRKNKGGKRDTGKLSKRRHKDLMRKIKRRTKESKKPPGDTDGPLIFVGS